MSDPDRPHDRRVSDYIRGAVDEDERQQLEIELLEDPQLFEQVQHEALLRRGLGSTRLAEPETKPGWRGWLRPALTGVLALAVVALGIDNLRLNNAIDELQTPRTGIPVITLHDQRALLPGTEAQPGELGATEGPVLLEIDVSAYEEQEFQVEILTDRDTYTYERVRADARGYLTVLLTDIKVEILVLNNRGEVLITREID